MNDEDIIAWLNYWLVSFAWSSETRLCTLTFKDPYEHPDKATGKDLRECVSNAVKAHPASCTFVKIEPPQFAVQE